MNKPSHLKWLVDTKQQIKTADGIAVDVWELQHADDPEVLSKWAKYFREHYCVDALLDKLVEGTGLTRQQFLQQEKFPDAKQAPGPSTRAGDFAEILAADFVEFVLGYWCPRERWSLKWNRNESTKGSDIVGFKWVKAGTPSADDEMFVLESKADMSGQPKNRLQDAVDDSVKDKTRQSMTLNAIKQRYLERNENNSAELVARFQNQPDKPFRVLSGAVAVISEEIFDATLIKATKTNHHPNASNLMLIVVKGKTLMKLLHALYERAANEA